MSAPLAVQKHIEELFEKDRFAEESWHVISYFPSDPIIGGYVLTESFGNEDIAREYFLKEQSEGRHPKMFHQVTTTRTESVKV